MKKIKTAIVDDHPFMRKGLRQIFENDLGLEVILEASNGKDFIEILQDQETLPDICILDISMPVMNGHETCAYLAKHYPSIKVIALSMHNDAHNIITMICNGARGYLSKTAESSEIAVAIKEVYDNGFYHSDFLSEELHIAIKTGEIAAPKFTDKEITFLRLCCKDLTYSAIAEEMCISARTVDNYRESLFKKVKTKSKVGLVIYAYKTGIVQVFE